MKKILLLLIIAFMLTRCATVFQPNPHPELNRKFKVGRDLPGEYQY